MNGAVITNLGLLYIGTVMPKTMQTPLMSIFLAFFSEGILSFGGILSFWVLLTLWLGKFPLSGKREVLHRRSSARQPQT